MKCLGCWCVEGSHLAAWAASLPWSIRHCTIVSSYTCPSATCLNWKTIKKQCFVNWCSAEVWSLLHYYPLKSPVWLVLGIGVGLGSKFSTKLALTQLSSTGPLSDFKEQHLSSFKCWQHNVLLQASKLGVILNSLLRTLQRLDQELISCTHWLSFCP